MTDAAPHPDLPPGPIDIHSHLLPGIDDGCQDLDESLACVRMLKQHGYVGSICTPHVWPAVYPHNTPEHIAAWTIQLRRDLADRGEDYPIWPGAEVRLFDGVIAWFESTGVPTLADSRCVLVDLWEDAWPRWADPAMDWLLERAYQPILAHPERIGVRDGMGEKLAELSDRGVWLQGNARCMTGEEGYRADKRIRQWLAEGRYTFLALDMHRPAELTPRMEGLEMIEQEFGRATLQRLAVQNPRRLVLGAAD